MKTLRRFTNITAFILIFTLGLFSVDVSLASDAMVGGPEQDRMAEKPVGDMQTHQDTIPLPTTDTTASLTDAGFLDQSPLNTPDQDPGVTQIITYSNQQEYNESDEHNMGPAVTEVDNCGEAREEARSSIGIEFGIDDVYYKGTKQTVKIGERQIRNSKGDIIDTIYIYKVTIKAEGVGCTSSLFNSCSGTLERESIYEGRIGQWYDENQRLHQGHDVLTADDGTRTAKIVQIYGLCKDSPTGICTNASGRYYIAKDAYQINKYAKNSTFNYHIGGDEFAGDISHFNDRSIETKFFDNSRTIKRAVDTGSEASYEFINKSSLLTDSTENKSIIEYNQNRNKILDSDTTSSEHIEYTNGLIGINVSESHSEHREWEWVDDDPQLIDYIINDTKTTVENEYGANNSLISATTKIKHHNETMDPTGGDYYDIPRISKLTDTFSAEKRDYVNFQTSSFYRNTTSRREELEPEHVHVIPVAIMIIDQYDELGMTISFENRTFEPSDWDFVTLNTNYLKAKSTGTTHFGDDADYYPEIWVLLL